MQEHSIRRKNTVWATPQQNGVTECKNHILAELVTAALNESKLPKAFWGEALHTVNCILNITPSEALPADKLPCKTDQMFAKFGKECEYIHQFVCEKLYNCRF
jgi:hypothetical protein